MNAAGERLREERERLGKSQGAFGDIGGVKANAQGKYEKGERFPDAAYLASVAKAGVDVLYIITGIRTPTASNSISSEESHHLKLYRSLDARDREAVERLVSALAATAKGNAT